MVEIVQSLVNVRVLIVKKSGLLRIFSFLILPQSKHKGEYSVVCAVFDSDYSNRPGPTLFFVVFLKFPP